MISIEHHFAVYYCNELLSARQMGFYQYNGTQREEAVCAWFGVQTFEASSDAPVVPDTLGEQTAQSCPKAPRAHKP